MGVVLLAFVAGGFLAAVAAAGLIAAVQRVSLALRLRAVDASFQLEVGVSYLWFQSSHTWHLPVKPPPKPGPGSPMKISLQFIEQSFSFLGRVREANHQLWKRVIIPHLDLTIQLGMGDAAQTAIWTGRLSDIAAWWISSRIAPRASRPPTFSIEPLWDESGFSCNFSSIIQLRPSDIILAIASGLWGQGKGGLMRGKPVRNRDASLLGASD